MDNKSTYNLCEQNGIDVASALVDKIRRPKEVELRMGSTVLSKIREISHGMKDGRPVVSGEDPDGTPIVFQFTPDFTSFRLSAMDADGRPICPEETLSTAEEFDR